MELVEAVEEIDVSGGNPLERREGLRAAVEQVEAGEVDVVVVAYFDRLFRSLRVQGEVVSRVEAAGGRVLALDFGLLSEATAAQWLSGTMLGAVSEYYRRSAAERIAGAQARAVAEGTVPFAAAPPGYDRIDGRLVPNGDAGTVREAFEMRAAGVTLREIRAFLHERGVEVSYRRTQELLRSRLVLGEVHFGKLTNLAAHEPIIDRDLFTAVQRVRETRGTQPRSDRLLARLGVLRCGTCGGRLVTGFQTSKGRRYPFYRCSPTGDCPRRVTIGAEMIEGLVIEKVQEALRGVEGRATAVERHQRAQGVAERAQADLEAAIRAFGGVEDEPVAFERLSELRAVRDAAVEELHELGDLSPAMVVTADEWDRLSLTERRGLVRAEVARVVVAPGRGLGRVRVEMRGE